MNPAPLQLRGCYFTRVSVAVQPDANEADSNRVDLEVESEAHPQSENPRAWFIAVTVRVKAMDGASPGYLGEIEAVGTFSVIDSWKEDQVEKLVYINGSGIIYSAIREMICTITSRGFFPMLVIPSWSFSDMYKELEESRKKEE